MTVRMIFRFGICRKDHHFRRWMWIHGVVSIALFLKSSLSIDVDTIREGCHALWTETRHMQKFVVPVSEYSPLLANATWSGGFSY
jgi:hypothetical protein